MSSTSKTDGLLDQLTKIHSLVFKNIDTGDVYSLYKDGHDSDTDRANFEYALRELMNSDEIIGHNIIKFDIPAIQKIYPWFQPKGKVTDTLVISRLIYPEIQIFDAKLLNQVNEDGEYIFPRRYYGQHGLESWGYRLELWKGDYQDIKSAEYKELQKQAKSEGRQFGLTLSGYTWGQWSKEMQDYCEQDVIVTEKLYRVLMSKLGEDTRAVELEHQVVNVCSRMEQKGFPFKVKEAEELYTKLCGRREELRSFFSDLFPTKREYEEFIPKTSNSRYGYTKGVPFTKERVIKFNPNSGDHIEKWYREDFGWKPTAFTETGKAKLDEENLESLDLPGANELVEWMHLKKVIGYIGEGQYSWLKVERDGAIRASYNTNGAVTGRATHSSPNIGQVPSVRKPYGLECRSLFYPGVGRVLVGSDLSGIELRCLGAYVARFDDGEYVKTILEGDVHTANQKAAGLPTRDAAKTFIYAFLYGAGAAKIGSIVLPEASEKAQRDAGTELINEFLRKTPGLDQLRNLIQLTLQDRGFLYGMDGRRLVVRKSHAALNTLLQNAGAVIAKKWLCLIDERLPENNYIAAWVHDEVQVSCTPEDAEVVAKLAEKAAEDAGKAFDFPCPIAAESKLGKTWAETH